MDIPEKGRLSAHVLVDAVSVSSIAEWEDPIDATNFAWQRLNDIEAVDAHLDETEGEAFISVDLSHVLGGALVTLDWLVTQLMNARDQSRDEIIVALREHLDS